MADGSTFQPDNTDADGKPLSGEQTVTVAPSGRITINWRAPAGSVGIRTDSLPKPGLRVPFTGEIANRLPLVNRWEIAQHPWGEENTAQTLPWYRSKALTPKQRDMIERLRWAERPLPPDLAAAVRAADVKTAGDFDHVSFRDNKVFAHRTPIEAAATTTGAKTVNAEEAAALPQESPPRLGRRPLPAAAFTPKKPPDMWLIGRVALSLCAVVAFVPFVRTLILLMVQLEELGGGNLLAFMVGRAGTGVPGLQHFASSVFWLGATVSLFAVVAAVLRLIQDRVEKAR